LKQFSIAFDPEDKVISIEVATAMVLQKYYFSQPVVVVLLDDESINFRGHYDHLPYRNALDVSIQDEQFAQINKSTGGVKIALFTNLDGTVVIELPNEYLEKMQVFAREH